LADGICTSSSRSSARLSAAAWVTGSWRVIVSVICWPIVNTGSNASIGSWKIIDTAVPRTSASLPSSRPSMSLPSITTPPVIRLLPAGSSRIIAFRVTLLPEPDSPRMVMTSPRASSNVMPLTALTVASRLTKRTARVAHRDEGRGHAVIAPPRRARPAAAP